MLDFSVATNSFNLLGDNANFAGSALPTDQVIGAGDLVVVYNLGIAGANAYAGDNTFGDHIRGVQAGRNPNQHYQQEVSSAIGQQALSRHCRGRSWSPYVCNGNNLIRTVGSTLSTTASCATSGVGYCRRQVDCSATTFNYSGSDLQRNAVVTLWLTLQDATAARR